MKKNILTTIAILLLVSVLTFALVACSADSYEDKLEKNNYETEDYEDDDLEVQTINRALEAAGGYEGKATWLVVGQKAEFNIANLTSKAGFVAVIKFEKSADAKKFAESDLVSAIATILGGKSDTVEVKGSIVMIGDAESVALVK